MILTAAIMVADGYEMPDFALSWSLEVAKLIVATDKENRNNSFIHTGAGPLDVHPIYESSTHISRFNPILLSISIIFFLHHHLLILILNILPHAPMSSQ